MGFLTSIIFQRVNGLTVSNKTKNLVRCFLIHDFDHLPPSILS